VAMGLLYDTKRIASTQNVSIFVSEGRDLKWSFSAGTKKPAHGGLEGGGEGITCDEKLLAQYPALPLLARELFACSH
jgi:hypothetical protein